MNLKGPDRVMDAKPAAYGARAQGNMETPFMPEADVTKEEIDAFLAASRPTRSVDRIMLEIREARSQRDNANFNLDTLHAELIGARLMWPDDTKDEYDGNIE